MGMWAEIKLAINSTLGNIDRFLPLDKIVDKTEYEQNANAVRIIHDMNKASGTTAGDLVVIPWGRTIVEQNDFDSQSLEYCLIPNTVETIGENAFSGMEHLSGISLPSRVAIKDGAFGDAGISWVDAKNVTTIGKRAFYQCQHLKEFSASEIEGGSVGEKAFAGCVSLEKVRFPKSLVDIGRECFLGCSNLKHFIYEGTMQDWQGGVSVTVDAFYQTPLKQITCVDGKISI